jgi:uncharacterized protein
LNEQLPEPCANADSQVYWEGARDHRLMIRKCNDCGELHFMPRYLCPHCWSNRLDWVEAKGSGTVHSYTVVRRASAPAFNQRVPYVVALIELDEGPRMMANILGKDALDVSIGDRVQVTFESRGNGALPQFNRVTA